MHIQKLKIYTHSILVNPGAMRTNSKQTDAGSPMIHGGREMHGVKHEKTGAPFLYTAVASTSLISELIARRITISLFDKHHFSINV